MCALDTSAGTQVCDVYGLDLCDARDLNEKAICAVLYLHLGEHQV